MSFQKELKDMLSEILNKLLISKFSESLPQKLKENKFQWEPELSHI